MPYKMQDEPLHISHALREYFLRQELGKKLEEQRRQLDIVREDQNLDEYDELPDDE